MVRRFILVIWAGIGISAGAESWVAIEPRPGHETVARTDAAGADETWIVLQPNREVSISAPIDARKLQVELSATFSTRTDAASECELFWRMDDGPEKRAARTSGPAKTSSVRGKSWIPGVVDRVVLELPAGKVHALRFRTSSKRELPVLLRFSWTAAAAEATKKEAGPAGPGWRFGGEYEFQIAYDDNVFRFGARDRRDLANGSASDKFDHMKEPWDVIVSNRVEGWIGYGTSADSIALGARITDRRFLVNRIKSTDELEAFTRLELWNSAEFRLYGWWRPRNFVRNLDSIEEPGTARSKCTYDEFGGGLRWRQKWADFLATRLGYELVDKDYNSDFDERDSIRHRGRVGVRFTPIKEFYADARYEFEVSESAASSGEPDTSFIQHAPRLEAGAQFGSFFAGAAWLFEHQSYTTSNSSTQDPSHADRVDKRNRYEVWAGFRFDLGKSVELELKLTYAHDRNSTSLPTTTTGLEEGREYKANILGFSGQLRF